MLLLAINKGNLHREKVDVLRFNLLKGSSSMPESQVEVEVEDAMEQCGIGLLCI